MCEALEKKYEADLKRLKAIFANSSAEVKSVDVEVFRLGFIYGYIAVSELNTHEENQTQP
tara:strand:- start:1156 stop:1335 length:180 start_codon:yes stop_codon:yes gene_type:complete